MGRPKLFAREEVLAEAVQVFWTQGFKDTSLQDLERATGVNKSGLYSEFKGKDDLFTQGLSHYMETSQVLVTLQREPLGWKNLEDFLLLSGQCERQKGCFVANSIREFSILPASARQLIQGHLGRVREALRENVLAANPRVGVDSATDMILTFNSGACLRHNLGQPWDLEKQAREFLEVLRR